MLEATNCVVQINDTTILDDVSVQINPGELTVIIGPNGAGKTTLFSLLAGDITPVTGTVTLHEQELAAWKSTEAARKRAVMVQDSSVSFPFPVRDVVAMGRHPWNRTERAAEDDAVVDAAMKKADIEHLAQRTVTVISGGERQRTAFARVIAQEGTTVLLDEPVSALDIAHQEHTLQWCRQLAHSGAAVAVVLHDLDAAAVYADKMVLMSRGQIIASGTVAEVCTEQRLSEVYNTPIDVFERNGTTRVLPLR